MRLLIALLPIVIVLSAFGQEKNSSSVEGKKDDIWARVATFEDNVVEVNTTTVSVGTDNIGRVQFRFIYDKPQPLPWDSKVKFKTQVAIVDFNCEKSLWKTYQLNYLDNHGKVIDSQNADPKTDWKKFGSFGGGGINSEIGCKLIRKHGSDLAQPKPENPSVYTGLPVLKPNPVKHP
jgi:hypothetical protein